MTPFDVDTIAVPIPPIRIPAVPPIPELLAIDPIGTERYRGVSPAGWPGGREDIPLTFSIGAVASGNL